MSDSVLRVEQAVPSLRDFTREVNEAIRFLDVDRGKRILERCGYHYDTQMYRDYCEVTRGKKNLKARREFVAKFVLSTYRLVKLNEVNVFYIEDGGSNLYKRCYSKELLSSQISQFYQLFFGLDSDIKQVTDDIIASILPQDRFSSIERNYIQVVDGYYWSRREANIVSIYEDELGQMPRSARAFARMFDTDDTDANIFKVPEFDADDVHLMLDTYNKLKDTEYYNWPDEYHFQCFKDWSDNRLDVEYGMFSELAMPFLRVMPRGSIFNTGEGHNGKSVLNGLAISIIGGNNVSTVVGDELGSWDHLVNFQTTWMNIPNETTVDFLSNNTAAFKAISAHETYSIRHKNGDVSVPVNSDFPMVFNINKLPDFADDASAVLSRMFINNFDVDFEKTGRVIKEYAKKMFLSDKTVMPTIVGATLAFAHYYSQDEHLWQPSDSMLFARNLLAETAVPKNLYFEWLTTFFDSFTGIKIPKADFINFGSSEGENYDGSVIKIKDMSFGRFKRQTTKDRTIYKIENKDKFIDKFTLSDSLYIRKYMGPIRTVKEFHENGGSLVHMMREDYLGRMEEYERNLKIAKIEKSKDEKRKKILQEMFNDIDKEQRGTPYESGR